MDNMDVFWDGTVRIIKNILDKKYWDNEQNGEYYSTIYADYRDEISDDTIRDFMRNDSPLTSLEEKFFEMQNEYAWEYEYPELLEEIKAALPQELYEHFEEDIREWLESHVYYEIDEKHYNRDVCLTLLVDAGDANYEYTCNNILNYASDGTGEFPAESSVLWLARQQGKEESLKKAVKDYFKADDFKAPDSFCSSVMSELINLTTGIGALTFLVKMPLIDYLRLVEQIKSKDNGVLVIPKDTTCGLFNRWDGGGSVFEVELEQDVKVPFSMIGDLSPDINKCYGIHGYMNWSVHNVYGVNDSLWRTELSVCNENKDLEEDMER